MKTLVAALGLLAAAAAAAAAAGPARLMRLPRTASAPAPAPAPAAESASRAAPAFANEPALPHARRARSLPHAHTYDYGANHHYAEPHAYEYYTVGRSSAPVHYELGARHVLKQARTRYDVHVPVTYSYTYESAPATSVVSYAPAHSDAYAYSTHDHAYSTHDHAYSTHDHAYPVASSVYSPSTSWQWQPAWC